MYSGLEYVIAGTLLNILGVLMSDMSWGISEIPLHIWYLIGVGNILNIVGVYKVYKDL